MFFALVFMNIESDRVKLGEVIELISEITNNYYISSRHKQQQQ
jgi:flagellin-specific chaperone FliS